MQRCIFFISDRTGITAETLGRSLLTQFSDIEFHAITLPFVDDIDKTQQAVKQINRRCILDGVPALIFSTQIDPQCRKLLAQSQGELFDFFDTFILKMERLLGIESSHTIGLTHGGLSSDNNYLDRINSIDFVLNNDDGISTKNYDNADVILLGVSRSGKTPTCLMLALQYGIRAANYPLIEQDLHSEKLPSALKKHQHKLFGLTTNPMLLHRIRTQRKSNSRYATLSQCKKELRYAQDMFSVNHISFINTSQISIEEIASSIVSQANLKRRH